MIRYGVTLNGTLEEKLDIAVSSDVSGSSLGRGAGPEMVSYMLSLSIRWVYDMCLLCVRLSTEYRMFLVKPSHPSLTICTASMSLHEK